MGFDLKRFEILVEPKDYFTCGERVNCILIIEIIGVLKSKHILVTAIGEVFAKFYNFNERNVTVNIMQIPFNFGYLVGFEEIKTGIYRVPFSFILPNAVLPTFKVKNGKIWYYVEAIIEKDLISDFFYKTTAEFLVKTKSNVSLQDIDSVPVAVNCEKLLRVFGVKLGSVRLSTHIDRNIYSLGENIKISFHLDNRYSNPIRLIPQLQQKTAFRYGYSTLDSRETISMSCTEWCSRNNSMSDICFLKIPLNCISTLDSPLISAVYEISFFVEICDTMEYFDKTPIYIA